MNHLVDKNSQNEENACHNYPEPLRCRLLLSCFVGSTVQKPEIFYLQQNKTEKISTFSHQRSCKHSDFLFYCLLTALSFPGANNEVRSDWSEHVILILMRKKINYTGWLWKLLFMAHISVSCSVAPSSVCNNYYISKEGSQTRWMVLSFYSFWSWKMDFPDFPVNFQLERPWSQTADSESQMHLTNPQLKIQDGNGTHRKIPSQTSTGLWPRRPTFSIHNIIKSQWWVMWTYYRCKETSRT